GRGGGQLHPTTGEAVQLAGHAPCLLDLLQSAEIVLDGLTRTAAGMRSHHLHFQANARFVHLLARGYTNTRRTPGPTVVQALNRSARNALLRCCFSGRKGPGTITAVSVRALRQALHRATDR